MIRRLTLTAAIICALCLSLGAQAAPKNTTAKGKQGQTTSKSASKQAPKTATKPAPTASAPSAPAASVQGDPMVVDPRILARALKLDGSQTPRYNALVSRHNAEYRKLNALKTPDRTTRIADLRKQFRTDLQQILTPEQTKRMTEMRPMDVVMARLAVELGLSADQEQALRTTLDRRQADLKEMMDKAQKENWSEDKKREAMTALKEQMDTEIKGILTPEQLKKMNSRAMSPTR